MTTVCQSQNKCVAEVLLMFQTAPGADEHLKVTV